MVMGVFMATLLVGMIYYIWGIGDAIMFRERMQDASDTAAFSAAVIHARGMNMLALLNMIMAALVFVAATMATIASMIFWAATAATAVCLGCGPYCAPCCNACQPAADHWGDYSTANNLSNRIDDIIDGALQVINAYADGIRWGVPIAAQAKVFSYGSDVYAPVTTLGAMLPIVEELPAQDDETNWPCDEKVLWKVRIAASAGVFVFTSPSIYLAAGIAGGQAEAQSITRERGCEDEYFQRITDDAQDMGNVEYQVQAYMLGENDREWTQRGVAIATWGEGDDAGGLYDSLAEMGRVSFAQAEFMYDDDESDWHEWLWHMNWRARLRRWRLEPVGLGGLTEGCAKAARPPTPPPDPQLETRNGRRSEAMFPATSSSVWSCSVAPVGRATIPVKDAAPPPKVAVAESCVSVGPERVSDSPSGRSFWPRAQAVNSWTLNISLTWIETATGRESWLRLSVPTDSPSEKLNRWNSLPTPTTARVWAHADGAVRPTATSARRAARALTGCLRAVGS